jgi:hypothetical protein
LRKELLDGFVGEPELLQSLSRDIVVRTIIVDYKH